MYQLSSNIVRAGQFKQFVQVSAPALQSITKKIAAIKNCEVAGLQNIYELINSLYIIFRVKCKQRYAYIQHLYRKTVDTFARASCGYFLLKTYGHVLLDGVAFSWWDRQYRGALLCT